MDIKVENWNGHEIRFVEKDPGDWWAVAKDVADALDYRMASDMTRLLDAEDKGTRKVRTTSDKAKCPKTLRMIIISESGIYDAIWSSHKPEAKEFKRWVKQVLKSLRRASGLEGFQVFRMLDKEHQREAMRKLNESLDNPVQINYIRVNTIANAAISRKYGYPKMVKKGQMTPEMLVDRQPALEDATELEAIKAKYNLSLSVSDIIYEKYCHRTN